MNLIGCVDTLSDTCLAGWAADSTSGDPVQVDIVVNSSVVATVFCARFREDLLLAGIGDGRKGFDFDPSAHLRPGINSLEVRYTATGVDLPRGRGRWVRLRHGQITDWQADFLAALEAYYEFRPEHHVCGIGERSRDLERVLRDMRIPFRKFTYFESSQAAATTLAEKADLVVSCEWTVPTAEHRQVLKKVAADHMNHPGFLALGFIESPQIALQPCQWLIESGIPAGKLESLTPAVLGEHRVFAFAEIGGAATLARTESVLAHVHVPKCAGTSFRALLEKQLGPRHLSLYVNDTYFTYGNEVLRSYLLHDPEIRAMSSHHIRVFPHWLAGREMLYVTFLRDPIQQFVSYMTHIKKYYARITAKSLLQAVPPDAPHLALRDFARWPLTQERDIPFRENHNVNFFARHSAPQAVDRLAAAQTALEGFFFVGITERMEESMQKLRALVANAGLEFPPDPLPVENISADYRDDLNWINPDDEVGSMLFRSVEKDRQLYDWAVARFEQFKV